MNEKHEATLTTALEEMERLKATGTDELPRAEVESIAWNLCTRVKEASTALGDFNDAAMERIAKRLRANGGDRFAFKLGVALGLKPMTNSDLLDVTDGNTPPGRREYVVVDGLLGQLFQIAHSLAEMHVRDLEVLANQLRARCPELADAAFRVALANAIEVLTETTRSKEHDEPATGTDPSEHQASIADGGASDQQD